MDKDYSVLVGACIITMVNTAGPRSFSLIYIELMEIYHSSAAATAGIGSLLAGVQLFAGSLAAIVSSRYSYRTAVLLGAALRSSGYLLSSLAPSIWYLYITLGITAGIGGALCMNSAFMIISQNFDKYRGRALGIMTAFQGVGTFIFPILTQSCLKHFGLNITMVYLAGTTSLVLISAYLFGLHEKSKPDKINSHQKSRSRLKWSLLFEPEFAVFCVIICMTFTGNSMTIAMLPALSSSHGTSRENASYLMATFGLTSTLAVLVHGITYDTECVKPIKKLVYASYIWLSAFSSFLAAISDSSYSSYLISAVLFGIANSSTASQRVTMLGSMVDVENLPVALGMLGIFQGFGMLSGPVVAGIIHDLYGDYNRAYYFAAAITTIAGLTQYANHFYNFNRKKNITAL